MTAADATLREAVAHLTQDLQAANDRHRGETQRWHQTFEQARVRDMAMSESLAHHRLLSESLEARLREQEKTGASTVAGLEARLREQEQTGVSTVAGLEAHLREQEQTGASTVAELESRLREQEQTRASTVAELEAQISQLKGELDNALQRQPVAADDTRYAEMVQQVTQSTADLSRAGERIQALQEQVEASSVARSALEEQLATCVADLKTVDETRAELWGKLQEATRQVAEGQATVAQLQADLASARVAERAGRAQRGADKAHLQQRLAQLEQATADEEEFRKTLAQEREDAQTAAIEIAELNEDLHRALSERNAEIRQLVSQKEQL